jgi:hypothetical protein
MIAGEVAAKMGVKAALVERHRVGAIASGRVCAE